MAIPGSVSRRGAEGSCPGLGLPGLALFFASEACVPGAGLWGCCDCFLFPRALTQGPFFLLQVSPSMFWDYGFLHQEPRVGGTHGRVRRDGSDSWRLLAPQDDGTGVRDCLPLPPTIACRSRRLVVNIVSFVLWTMYKMAGPVLPDEYDVAALFRTRCPGSRNFRPRRWG